MSAILELRAVGASYGHTAVLGNVSLAVEAGGITALLGANGAGKTTTLRAICNMLVRLSGEIAFEGKPITGMSTEKIVQLGIAHVPDGRGTFIHLSVEENLRLGAYMRRDRASVLQDMERVYNYFPKLRERYRQQAGTLSGGEQQMLAISRALMLRPKLLLLDEPSFGLAPLVVREIFQILATINQEEKVSVLLVEQNAKLALELADHAYLLETGHVVVGGTASALKDDDRVRHAYLGE